MVPIVVPPVTLSVVVAGVHVLLVRGGLRWLVESIAGAHVVLVVVVAEHLNTPVSLIMLCTEAPVMISLSARLARRSLATCRVDMVVVMLRLTGIKVPASSDTRTFSIHFGEVGEERCARACVCHLLVGELLVGRERAS